MLFNSFEFLVFLVATFAAYWFVLRGRTRAQNVFLLGASYVFYGWWDWRFLGLIIASSAVDFVVGRRLGRTTGARARRALLGVSLAVNLGCLGFFKYFDFFAETLRDAAASVGWTLDAPTLEILLPVGISFYTFQTLSYTIDIYRRRLEPVSDAVSFFAFVSFFPQLVAGPIERAAALLPQFQQRRRFELDAARDGLRQMLWGMFKKVVLADSCAVGANAAFDGTADGSSVRLALGLVFFAFQIYGDFSGYSDIAIGTARLFGFRLSRNFATPYFSRSVGEFWRRWHISLSTWFRDYVYIPLGGSRGGAGRLAVNLVVTFAVSGLWHGANWTFVVWGLLNGLYCLPGALRRHASRARAPAPSEPGWRDLPAMLRTFVLTLLAWTFFRASSAGDAVDYLARLLGGAGGLEIHVSDVLALAWIAVAVAAEWATRRSPHALAALIPRVGVRWTVYLLLTFLIGVYFDREQPFIYFQF